MLADYHVHTEYSDDSIYPMEEAVTDAIKMGLDEICFTDHLDYGVKCDWDSGKKLLHSIGFQHFCTYDRMKPIFHTL